MRLLDLDLDFFLSCVVHAPEPGTRPSLADTEPWTPDAVRVFLEHQCGLRTDTPIPGRLVTTHDQVFDAWHAELTAEVLAPQFEVVHVDAHADLGMGDSGYVYLLTELLQLPVEERAQRVRPANSRGMGEGNFLAFAIACRWIGALTYVKHPQVRSDVLRVLCRDRNPASGFIEMPHYDPGDARTFMRKRPKPLSLEPPVPFTVVPSSDFRDDGRFDRGYLCVSPRFVPLEAEALIAVVGEYLAFDSA